MTIAIARMKKRNFSILGRISEKNNYVTFQILLFDTFD